MPSDATNNASSIQFLRFEGTSGQWVRTDGFPFTELNRGFLYGDGVFDTCLINQGKLVEADNHLFKLLSAARAIDLTIAPIPFQELEKVVKNIVSTHVLRVYVVAGGGLGYGARDSDNMWAATLEPYNFPTKGVTVNVVSYPDRIDPRNPVHRYKTLSSLSNVLVARYAQAQEAGDALLINASQNLASLTSSCLAYGLGSQIYVMPLEDGTHSGAMRAAFLREVSSTSARSLDLTEIPALEWIIGLNSLRPTIIQSIDGLAVPQPPKAIIDALAKLYPHLKGYFPS